MMNITFGELSFTVSDTNVLKMQKCFDLENQNQYVCEFDIAGGVTNGSNRMIGSEEPGKLRYVSHNIENNTLTIIQRSYTVEVVSLYTKYDDTNAIRVIQTLKNISDKKLCLTMANTFGLTFGKDIVPETKDWYIHKFYNARYTEAMPSVMSLYELGMQFNNTVVHVENIGNHSSYEFLPQAVLENKKSGSHIMFQIESYADWFYEITVPYTRFCLQIGGPTAYRHAWNRHLAPGESYTTVPVALSYGKSINQTVGEMTKYRRHIKPYSKADAHLPVIYNEYMHYSWDDPIASRVYETAPAVAATGCEYYVIDCGWHNGKKFDNMLGMYRQFGTWFEERERFPEGIKAISDYIHSLGMKFGLWIAPEVVGKDNKKMLEYYDDECFYIRDGERVGNLTGYLLDFRHPKVDDYMTKTINRMIDEYGCDYIKFDGCANPGFGTEVDSTSLGDGLEKATDAFLAWSQRMIDAHPDVIFEDCAGGGQRMDYKALSVFSLISTSDQTDYNRYPYIAGNIIASVLPEQAAVWSYPVDSKLYDPQDEASVNGKVSKERVVINMVNALLGRIHLASRIQLLDFEKQALIKEGVELYNKLTPEKLVALPYLPKGYTAFGDSFVSAGFKTENKLYLAVWNLSGERNVTLPLPEIDVKNVTVAYPTSLPTSYSFDASSITVNFTEDEQARFFEIDI